MKEAEEIKEKELLTNLMDEIYYAQEKLEDNLILDEEKIKFTKDFLRKIFNEIYESR